jgi:hypothetical protein
LLGYSPAKLGFLDVSQLPAFPLPDEQILSFPDPYSDQVQTLGFVAH